MKPNEKLNVSYRHEKQQKMSKKDSFLYSETDWERLDKMTDENIICQPHPAFFDRPYSRTSH